MRPQCWLRSQRRQQRGSSSEHVGCITCCVSATHSNWREQMNITTTAPLLWRIQNHLRTRNALSEEVGQLDFGKRWATPGSAGGGGRTLTSFRDGGSESVSSTELYRRAGQEARFPHGTLSFAFPFHISLKQTPVLPQIEPHQSPASSHP